MPTEAELEALPADMTLKQSVGWLQAKDAPEDARMARPARMHGGNARPHAGNVLVRVARIAVIVAGALALTFGKAQ